MIVARIRVHFQDVNSISRLERNSTLINNPSIRCNANVPGVHDNKILCKLAQLDNDKIQGMRLSVFELQLLKRNSLLSRCITSILYIFYHCIQSLVPRWLEYKALGTFSSRQSGSAIKATYLHNRYRARSVRVSAEFSSMLMFTW